MPEDGALMSKSMKWILAALALSLAINVFVVGFAIGKKVVGSHSRLSGGPPTGGLNMRTLGRYLSEEEQRAARRLLGENRDYLREKGSLLRKNERQIRKVLMAETVDMQELNTLIEDHEVLMRDTHLTMRKVILEFVASLDVETRRAVAQDLFRRRGPGKEHRPGPPCKECDFDRPPPPGGF